MFPDGVPVQLSSGTVDALAIVRAWSRAFNARDLDRLIELSAPDIRLGEDRRAGHGYRGLERMLQLQTYGVAQQAHPFRYIAEASTVAVEAVLELRWVDSGELAETTGGVAVFEVRDGRVWSFRAHPDLTAAFRDAGWPPTDTPASPAAGADSVA